VEHRAGFIGEPGPVNAVPLGWFHG
jgi:hypothetical protein